MVSEHASPLAALGGVDAGGQNVHVAALAAALAARGHAVEVYTRRDDPALPERVVLPDGVEVVHVDAGPPRHVPKDDLAGWMPAFAADLVARWSHPSVPPDLVHAHFWMSGVAAVRARWATGVPVVVTFHALGSVKRRHHGAADPSPAGRVAVEARLAREADAVVATCTDEVRELFDLVGPRSERERSSLSQRLHVVPCGVDVRRFTPDGPRDLAPTAGPDGRARHRLLSVSRLVERKGVDTAVAALATLPGVELVVVGGPDAQGLAGDPEAARLLALAARLGVGDRVRLLGRVAHADLPGVLRSADVLVAAPWYEPFGIVPLEAMSCGLPVVGSAVGGLLDSVEPGVSGELVPARDPAALARALAPLLADPAQRRRYGHAARQRVLDRFGWDRVAETTEDAYARVLERGPGLRRGTPTSLEAM